MVLIGVRAHGLFDAFLLLSAIFSLYWRELAASILLSDASTFFLLRTIVVVILGGLRALVRASSLARDLCNFSVYSRIIREVFCSPSSIPSCFCKFNG